MAGMHVYRDKLSDVLSSKQEEFHMLGYEAISTDEIWDCVIRKYGDEWPALHVIVNDLFRLKPTDVMNRLTVQAFQGKIDSGKFPFV